MREANEAAREIDRPAETHADSSQPTGTRGKKIVRQAEDDREIGVGICARWSRLLPARDPLLLAGSGECCGMFRPAEIQCQ